MFAKFFRLTRPFTRSLAVTGAGRLLVILILLSAFSSAAGAYTLVMRNGRRVEVPANFVLSDKTVTYEAAPGMNVTLLLAVIDIAATERANSEAQGGFFKHGQTEVKNTAATFQNTVATPTQKARATVTNRDLEPARRARINSELAYEKRRRELGLPSISESRRRQAREGEELLDMGRLRAEDTASSEAFWRDRASALRSEIVTVDAQIAYLNSRLADFESYPQATSFVTSVYPLRSRFPFGRRGYGNQGLFGATGRRGAVRGQVFTNPGGSSFRLARPVRGFGSQFGFPVGISGYGNAGPYDYLDDSNARANLQERLDDLLVTRAGLSARWLQLENEARDARVPQVWLEP